MGPIRRSQGSPLADLLFAFLFCSSGWGHKSCRGMSIHLLSLPGTRVPPSPPVGFPSSPGCCGVCAQSPGLRSPAPSPCPLSVPPGVMADQQSCHQRGVRAVRARAEQQRCRTRSLNDQGTSAGLTSLK